MGCVDRVYRVIGIDPGYEQSAIVEYVPSTSEIHERATWNNEMLCSWLRDYVADPATALVIEHLESSFGMAVGREVFETVWWSGRFFEAWLSDAEHGGCVDRVKRKTVVTHLCGQARGRDSEVRQAIIDRFGASKIAAIGKKRSPGPLYGIKGHEFAALAVALTWADQNLK